MGHVLNTASWFRNNPSKDWTQLRSECGYFATIKSSSSYASASERTKCYNNVTIVTESLPEFTPHLMRDRD